MAEFKISAQVADVGAAKAFILGQMFPRVSAAVRLISSRAATDWTKAVHDAKLWSGEKRPYMASIKWEMTGPLSALVWSDYKYANEIEEGRPAKDLKRMLDTSQKVRRTQSGKRYLIIPFRHRVADMPDDVYQQARDLAPSRIIGQTTRRSGEITSAAFGIGMVPLSQKRQRRAPFLNDPSARAPVMVPKHIYQWGESLAAGSMGPNPRGKVDRYAGMYRFDTTSGKQKRSSAYLTFRILMEGSSGWVVAPKPGLFLAKGVADGLQSKANLIFSEAARLDLKS